MQAKRLRAATLVVLSVTALFVGTQARDAAAREPRGRGWIAYASDADGDYELFVMRPDGSRRRQLTDNDVDDFAPAWSPDGKRIVFERERGKDGYEDLYIFDLASGRARPWVVSRGVDEGDADWSPDGRWIAFRGNDGGDGADVIALSVDRKRGRIVSSQSENSTNADPAWSPDGKQVALTESYDGSGIYVASACCSQGYKKREVTYSDGWKLGLDWSPDGTCILYSEETYDGEGVDIYTVPAAGGTPKLVMPGAPWAFAGSWSPDGSRILYYSHVESSYDLYVMDADGSGTRRITSTARADEIDATWWAPPVDDPATPECGGSAEPEGGPATIIPPE